MNVLKHMEAVFVVALVTAAGASLAGGGAAPAAARLPVLTVNTSVPANLAVVRVTAKRMSAAEKRASLDLERAGGRGAARRIGRA
jgi:type IV secretory pathway protease TraF